MLHVIVTENEYFIYNYNKRKSPTGKGKHCPMTKNMESQCSAHWARPAKIWAPNILKKGHTLKNIFLHNIFHWVFKLALVFYLDPRLNFKKENLETTRKQIWV